MLDSLKKCITLLLLLGLTCPATACSGDGSSDESEIPPHLKPEKPDPDAPAKVYYPKQDGATRLVTYNVGIFSKYTDGSYEMIAEMMNEVKADLVGISELDSCTVRTKRVFQLKKFAELMGTDWSYVYHRAMPHDGGAYGDGMASREKPLRTFAVALPKGDGAEPRVAVVAEFAKYVYITTHLDHVSSRAQIEQVNRIDQTVRSEFADSKKPVFLGGDLNARPETLTLAKLKENWMILTPHGTGDYTFSSQKPSACIDYILLWKGNGAACEVVGSKILLNFNKGDIRTASDHIPVMVDVKF